MTTEQHQHEGAWHLLGFVVAVITIVIYRHYHGVPPGMVERTDNHGSLIGQFYHPYVSQQVQ